MRLLAVKNVRLLALKYVTHFVIVALLYKLFHISFNIYNIFEYFDVNFSIFHYKHLNPFKRKYIMTC